MCTQSGVWVTISRDRTCAGCQKKSQRSSTVCASASWPSWSCWASCPAWSSRRRSYIHTKNAQSPCASAMCAISVIFCATSWWAWGIWKTLPPKWSSGSWRCSPMFTAGGSWWSIILLRSSRIPMGWTRARQWSPRMWSAACRGRSPVITIRKINI